MKNSSPLRSAPYYLGLVIPLLSFLGLWYQGPFLFLTPLVTFLVIPLLDYLLGGRKRELESLTDKSHFFFLLPLILFIPFQWALLFWSTKVFTTETLNWWEQALVLVNASLVGGGLGITIAHEFSHRKEKWEMFAAQALLLPVNYMHWANEHVFGHHRYVATPIDPASARFNESIYGFLPRTLVGTWLKSFRREQAWARKLKRPNAFWAYTLLPLALALLLGFLWGLKGLIFFYGQALLSAILLELVNYVEHYGLSRQENPLQPGRYEKVQVIHSWNSSHILSNYFLFNLQLHSDHHEFAHRPYQQLRPALGAPQLPCGYPLMILLALVPPVWKKIIHPKLQQNLSVHR